MNLRCKVCGEKAAGFHFGAFTCEGCKSFFGRCCNNMSLIGECRNNKECVIDKKNRTSCKACRLHKCLTVGMSKNGSRYGRRSNWFKQFFQEAEHHVSRSRKSAPEVSGDHARGADTISPSSGLFADESDQKLCADLYNPTSVSSHLYFNYFPQYNLNRFISCGDGREAQLWLPNAAAPFTFLNSQFRVNDHFGKILAEQYARSERKHENDDLNENRDENDPLDLSRKRSDFAKVVHQIDAKKNSPLDLSTK